MQYAKILALLSAALSTGVMAARPANESICDYYTTALLKENTAANQYMLLKLLVNTVAIGNYTQPNMNAVPGILAPGVYMGTPVNLLPYFDGSLKSTNINGVAGSRNFLDGGGATPLMKNELPDPSSNQYKLVTHLYSFFGTLLGCSTYGQSGFPAYTGDKSQYQVHRFMDLDRAEMGWFIQQVALAASSFGVATDDVTAAGNALNNAFNYRCSPPAQIAPNQPADLQSMCQDVTCPLDPKATCAALPDKGTPLAPVPVSTSMMASSSAMMASSPSAYPTEASSVAAGGAGSYSTATMSAAGTPASPVATPAQFTGAADSLVAGAGAMLGAGVIGLAFAL